MFFEFCQVKKTKENGLETNNAVGSSKRWDERQNTNNIMADKVKYVFYLLYEQKGKENHWLEERIHWL